MRLWIPCRRKDLKVKIVEKKEEKPEN